MLESQGLIESVGNGAFAVAHFRNPLNASLKLLLSLDEASMREIYELRRILEQETAALAAERASATDVAEMDEAIVGMSEGLAADSGDLYIDADLRFHLAIAKASGNRLVLHTMHALRDLIRRALTSIYLIPSSARRSLEQHRRIRDAIAAGDRQRARDEMREHLVRVESDIHRIVAEGLGSDGARHG